MPVFHYKALNTEGESVEGEMDAPSEGVVIAHLQDAGLLPIRTSEVGTSTPKRKTKRRKPGKQILDSKGLGLFTSKLAVMLRAGLPLDNALLMLTELVPEGEAEKMVTKIRADVQHGQSLSDALNQYPNVFNAFYVSTVRSGETAGALDTVLVRLTEYLERRQALRETVLSALTYPAILLTVAVISVGILLGYVVPHFSELYDGIDQALPIPTAIIIGISEFVRDYWWLLFVLIGLTIWGARKMYESPASRARVDRLLLKLPLVGDLITKVEIARFTRTLGTLLENGVPLLSSLSIIQNVITNSQIKQAILQITDELREGRTIAGPLKKSGLFPNMATNLIHVGEETGELEKMLNQVAEIYEGEVKSSVTRLLAVLGPAIIIILGIIIAFIIFSVLLAILGLNDFV